MAKDYRDIVLQEIDKRYESRYQFCQSFGLSQSFLSKIGNHEKHFSMPTLVKVCKRLHLKVKIAPECDCCERQNEYNGYGSDGPRLFTCPESCPCHD